MDEQWVEEDSVTLLHLQMHPKVLRVIASHSMVHLIHPTLRSNTVYECVCLPAGMILLQAVFCVCVCVCIYLPLGVVVLLQRAGVCSWQNDQAAILSVHFLHCCPGADDPVGRSEREVMQILMHRVTRRLLT